MSFRGLSLVGRITAASALAAALGGATAALSAGVVAKQLNASQEMAQLRKATKKLASELAEEIWEQQQKGRGKDRAAMAVAVLEDELDDVKLESARATLWFDRERAAGATDLPLLAPNECQKLTLGAEVLRACSMRVVGHGFVTLATSTQAEEARSELLFRALLGGSLGGALFGGLLSYVLARWAIAPLNALRDGVREVRSEEPLLEPIAALAREPEIEELRAAIANLVERLGLALRHAQAFAAEAAHELRTPLTTIAGELELMAESGGADPVALDRVRAQVQELTALVQRLLVLAQPSALGEGETEVVDLSDVLAAVHDGLKEEARARVHAQCDDDVLVRGDSVLLRALLSNALDNALKFSSGMVDVSVRASGQHATIDVRDRGPGVTAEERARVFAPFYRSPSARAGTAKGHGLGLALIASVARRHRGHASFIDSPHGAHLRIELPRLPLG